MTFHKYSKIFLVLFFVALAVSCTQKDGGSETPQEDQKFSVPDFTLNVSANEIKVMAYNVENYFDTAHDFNHTDWTYLPKDSVHKAQHCPDNKNEYYKEECFNLDWNQSIVDIKTEQLAMVVEAQGEAPDLLGLEEVENAAIVGKLGERLGYKNLIITSGSDNRGINNALLYKETKLQFLESRQVVVGGELNKHTRNILAAYFKPRKQKAGQDVIAIYVNHWPSQGNPASDRILAAETLKKMIDDDRLRFEKDGLVLHPIAVGDFNTLPEDTPHPFKTVISAADYPHSLISVNDVFSSLQFSDESPLYTLIQAMPKGTYYYKRKVQTLDYIFVGQNLSDGTGIEVEMESFRIIAPYHSSDIVTQKVIGLSGVSKTQSILVPKHLDLDATAPGHVGASDHFPVAVKIKLN